MSLLSPILRSGQGNGLMFWCPGCDIPHVVYHGSGAGPRWGWNGDADKPTFTPSILVRYPWGPEQKERVCHSFVTNGKIQFLTDCTHELAGQTVDIPNWEEA